MASDKILVVALGGNAVSPQGKVGTIPEQYSATREAMLSLATVVEAGYEKILITHGNGPQVGNILLRSEVASRVIYPIPLDTCVADSQGGMGYMIQMVLENCFRERKITKPAATIITQVLVDKDDPGFQDPTKFVGQFLTKEQADKKAEENKWIVKKDGNRGYRRVVASPKPKAVLELEMIRTLLEKKYIVIAAGGGGIPVMQDPVTRRLSGIEAVIDKDLATSLLASELGAGIFMILTAVEQVSLGFGTPAEKPIREIKVKDLAEHEKNGEFPPGSMGPKIEGAIQFLKNGGERVIITSHANMLAALTGERGTHILP